MSYDNNNPEYEAERARPGHRFSMKRLFRRIFALVVCLALAFALVRFGPNIYARFFGSGNTRWISERFSETLKEKNELVVFEIETTGQETVSQDAWLLGTVQKVEMPYTFNLSYTVDLSVAKVTLDGNTVVVGVPKPAPSYHKLVADDERMKKSDFFYPLTPERYADIKSRTEQRLYNEYGANADYAKNAWDNTVRNLETLFKSVAERSEQGITCEVRIEELAPEAQTDGTGDTAEDSAA